MFKPVVQRWLTPEAVFYNIYFEFSNLDMDKAYSNLCEGSTFINMS